MANLGFVSPVRPDGEIRRAVPATDGRREALERYEILDTEPEDAFSNIALLARELFDAPFAAISFLDDDRQWFKARVGLEISETPINQAFCRLAIAQKDAFVVKDAIQDPRFASNPLVLGASWRANSPVAHRRGAGPCVVGGYPRAREASP